MANIEPLSGYDSFLSAVCVFSGIYALIGHLALYIYLQGRVRTTRFLSNVPFYAVVRYFAQPPSWRSRKGNIFAITVAASVPISILSFFLLYLRIWSQ